MLYPWTHTGIDFYALRSWERNIGAQLSDRFDLYKKGFQSRCHVWTDFIQTFKHISLVKDSYFSLLVTYILRFILHSQKRYFLTRKAFIMIVACVYGSLVFLSILGTIHCSGKHFATNTNASIVILRCWPTSSNDQHFNPSKQNASCQSRLRPMCQNRLSGHFSLWLSQERRPHPLAWR